MDITSILDSKDITYTTISAEEIAIICPNQANHSDGMDSKPSFLINTSKAVGHCFACNFILGEVAMTKWLLGDEIDEFQLSTLKIKSQLKRLQNAEEPFLTGAEEFTMMPPSTQWDQDYRGISKEFLQLMGARHCKVGRYENRIIFHIYVNERLRGFDSRALGDQKPKYLRSKGFDAKDFGLYPYDHVKEIPNKNYVILCEGLFDALNSVYKSYPALCIFGTQFGMQKLSLLLSTGASEVILLLDNDSAGVAATSKITAEIKDWITVSIADSSILIEGKDLGDLNKEEIQYCIDNRRRVK